jgi:RNA polymerase sigma-70 factor (ECF subfamily)
MLGSVVEAEDVELWLDGGARSAAIQRTACGAEEVGRYMADLVQLAPTSWIGDATTVNGDPGIVVRYADGRPFAVLGLDVEDDHITAVRIDSDPHKLHGVPAENGDA